MGKIKKVLYVTVGLIALVLGAIGIALPILPTTPFLLLASFCFVKGSKRFDEWFRGTKIYKKHLETFATNRAMTMKQKVTILLFADIMIAFPLVIIDNLHVKILLALVIIFKLYYFIFKVRTISEKERQALRTIK
ncbi:YbaN family protein [Clostridium carnis]